MRKLENFKDWLTIEDAAKRLSVSAGEDISEAEILRLGLDRHLTLSVYFVNPVTADLTDIDLLRKNQFEYEESPDDIAAREALLDRVMDEFQATDQPPDDWLQPIFRVVYKDGPQNPHTLEGLWDLPMLGQEAFDIKREYQRLTGGIEANQTHIGGRLVKKHDEPEVFEIFQWHSEGEYCYPASCLLDDGMFVVRTAVLQEFEARLLCSEQSADGKKSSHLLAIAGLLELLTDQSRPRYNQGSAAERIEALHPDWRGSSTSNLTKLFAEAKAAAKDAEKEAQAKADARKASGGRVTARKPAMV